MFLDSDSHAIRFLEAFGYSEGQGQAHPGIRNYCALSYRLEAKNTVIEHGRDRLSLEKGDIFFAPARTDYLRQTERDSVLVVHFELFDGGYFELEKFTPKQPEKYGLLFEKLLRTYESGEPDALLQCSSVLYHILGEICREKNTERQMSEDYRRIRAAMEEIRRAYCDPSLSVARLAAISGMSEAYFRKLFARENGISPRRYITELRIGKAAAMLRSPYYSLAEIAEKTGFCDAKYFGTVFRRVTGMTPARYSIEPCNMRTRWRESCDGDEQ